MSARKKKAVEAAVEESAPEPEVAMVAYELVDELEVKNADGEMVMEPVNGAEFADPASDARVVLAPGEKFEVAEKHAAEFDQRAFLRRAV